MSRGTADRKAVADEQTTSDDTLPQAEPARDGGPARTRALRAWGVILAVALVIGAFAALQLARTGANPSRLARAYGFTIGDFRAQGERESRPAPDLFGEDMQGRPLALKDYRGKVVVVNLWASWCGPCRREQPVFERLWREYKGRGVQFLGVNLRDQKAAALSFIDEFGVTYPSFFDQSSRLAFELQAQVLPTTYLIDAEGNLFFRFTGTVDEPLLRTAIDAALAPEKESSGG